MKQTKFKCFFYIKNSKLFSVNEGPQKGWPPDWGCLG